MKKLLTIICLILGLSNAFSQNYNTVNVCYYHNDESGLNQVLHTTDTIVWVLEEMFNGEYFAIPGYFVVESESIYPIVNEGDTIIRISFDPGQNALLDTLDTVIVHIVKQPEICLVSGYSVIDTSTGIPVPAGIIVAVDSSTMVGYDTVHVQRETAGVFTDIGIIVKQNSMIFIDTTADFSSQAFTYQLFNGYCGESEPHTSIHLQTNGRNLNWTSYVGLDNLTGFYIYRMNPGDTAWAQIGTTANINATSYTDNSLTYQDSAVFLVEALRNGGCNTSVWKTNETEFTSGSIRSNIAISVSTGISEFSKAEISISPNPATTQLTIKTDNTNQTDYTIYDVTGRILNTGSFNQNTTITITDFAKGNYFIQLTNNQNTTTQKFIKQ